MKLGRCTFHDCSMQADVDRISQLLLDSVRQVNINIQRPARLHGTDWLHGPGPVASSQTIEVRKVIYRSHETAPVRFSIELAARTSQIRHAT